jgi:glycolate oxidase FAD binding subunit
MKAGAVRDHVLAVKSVSGLGIAFSCGGKVVKNVTGFDLPKLLTGSMGTLAVMTELTLRVGPAPETEVTLAYHGLDSQAASALMRDGISSPMEVSGAAFMPFPTSTVYLRLEGPAPSVPERAKSLIRELHSDAPVNLIESDQSQELWRSIRDVRCFSASTKPLWRLAVPPSRAAMVVATISQNLPCRALYDRAGALVWLECDGNDPGESWVRTAVSNVQGYATLFRASPEHRSTIAPFHPEQPALGKVSEMIKMAFDPLGILEPNRMVRGR